MMRIQRGGSVWLWREAGGVESFRTAVIQRRVGVES
jgi:hypothetical protein